MVQIIYESSINKSGIIGIKKERYRKSHSQDSILIAHLRQSQVSNALFS